MLRNKLFLILFLSSSFLSSGQEINDSVTLRNYILEHAEEFKLSKEIVTDPKYRLQLMYTQVDHSDSVPRFSMSHFGTHQYYYPASLVKFPIALLALSHFRQSGISLDDIPVFGSEVSCNNDKFITLSQSKSVCFRQMILEMMALSDNNFYSAFYHLLNPKLINDRLENPASLVKFPIALLALSHFRQSGISLDDIPVFGSEVSCNNDKFITLSQSKSVCFRQMILEMMALSDNNFYSAFYHLLNPKLINDRLENSGYFGTNIYKAFTGCERADQLKTNSCEVVDSKGEFKSSSLITVLDTNEMLMNYSFLESRLFGSKHEDENGDIVSGPYDLNYNLELPLPEVNDMLIHLMYPEVGDQKFLMRNEDREFLIESMQKYPREVIPSYPARRYWKNDNDLKYAIVGEESTAHKTKTTSKLGLSYGFTSEIAHVKNEADGVEFFMSVSLYTNANDIVNDGEYEYTEVARPFVARLSKLLYAYELEKSKKK